MIKIDSPMFQGDVEILSMSSELSSGVSDLQAALLCRVEVHCASQATLLVDVKVTAHPNFPCISTENFTRSEQVT